MLKSINPIRVEEFPHLVNVVSKRKIEYLDSKIQGLMMRLGYNPLRRLDENCIEYVVTADDQLRKGALIIDKGRTLDSCSNNPVYRITIVDANEENAMLERQIYRILSSFCFGGVKEKYSPIPSFGNKVYAFVERDFLTRCNMFLHKSKYEYKSEPDELLPAF